MRLREILAETQIVNIDDQIGTKQSASDFLRYIARDVAIAGWFLTKARKWLLNSYQGPALLPVNARAKVFQDVPWIQKAAAEGQPIFAFAWDRDPALETKMRNIRDWLAYLKQNEPREFAKIDRVSFDQASVAEERWHAEMARRAEKNKTQVVGTDGVKPVLKIGDLQWVQLTSAAALKAEGDFMGHCVGTYCDQVEDGSTLIYSLRDAKNVAHVTMEFSVGGYDDPDHTGKPKNPTCHVEQIKGKGNAFIAERYKPAVLALVEKLGAKWTHEGVRDFDKTGGFWLVEEGLAKFEDVAQRIYNINGVRILWLTDAVTGRGRVTLLDHDQVVFNCALAKSVGWYVLNLDNPTPVDGDRLLELWVIFKKHGLGGINLSHFAWQKIEQLMHEAGQQTAIPDWAKPKAAE